MKLRNLVFVIAVSALTSSIGLAQTTPSAATASALTTADMDGIWAIQNATILQQQAASYFSIRAAPSGLLVLIRLGTADWQAFVTTLNGNSATVITLTAQAINSWRIDFVSEQAATITGVLCISNGGGIQPLTPSPTVGATPATDVTGLTIRIGNSCFIPQGAVLNLSKVL